MKKPLHLVFVGNNSAIMYRQYKYDGEVRWKCIGSMMGGKHINAVQEYIDDTKRRSGREIETHSAIPENIHKT